MYNDYDKNVAVISYIGSCGNSKSCSEAIIDLLCRGDKLEHCKLLSSPAEGEKNIREHGFFLAFEYTGWFIVMPGYASGYGGGGPHELSRILAILENEHAPTLEIYLDEDEFGRLCNRRLLGSDIDSYQKIRRGGRATDYIFEQTWEFSRRNQLLERYDARVPLPLLHPSIQFLRSKIFSEPKDALREAYVILESQIREISGLKSHGASLFDEALKPHKGTLVLKNVEDHGEQAGFQYLIKGLYQLHRNPRMHRHIETWSANNYVSEFLVINHVLQLSDNLILNDKETSE